MIVAERQLRQAARHVARPQTRPIIVQESSIRPLAKSAQELGRPVEIPAVSLEVPDDLSHLLQIRFAASPDLVPGQVIDRIGRRHVEAQAICLGTERTDAGGDIQDHFAAKLFEIEREVTSILFQRATQQHDFVQDKALFHRKRFSLK